MVHVLHPVSDQDERVGVGRDDVRPRPETNELEWSGNPADLDFFFNGHERIGLLGAFFSSLENGEGD